MAKVIWDSEKELEDYIFNSATNNLYNPITGEGIDSIYRQVDLGSYGIADLLTFSYEPGYLEVTVIELKKEIIDIKTMAQLSRYHKALRKYFDGNYPTKPVSIRLIAVSTQINQGDDSVWLNDYLSDHSDFSAFLCDFDLNDGVSFSQTKGWYKKNEEFTKLHDSVGKLEIDSFSKYCEAAVEAKNKLSELSGDSSGKNTDS